MTELWKLEQVKRAFELVEESDLTYDEVTLKLEAAYEVSSWLRAEAHYKSQVTTWLQYENRWHLTQHLIENNPAYSAAEAGWLKMKQLAPALDGVSRFGDLSPILQARYAVFAEEAIRSVERIEFINYSDPDDDGQVCTDCPGSVSCCFAMHGEEPDDLGPYCEQCNDYH